MNKRSSKGKWSKEEIEKILDAKPIHNPAYFNKTQAKLIHNKNIDLKGWLAPKKGNNKKPETLPKIAQNPIECQKTPNIVQNNSGI